MPRHLVTNKRQTWATPVKLFNELDKEFKFTLDVAAENETTKCERFYTKEQDGLGQPWGPYEVVWCNPPYQNIYPWLEKGYYAYERLGSICVYLIPSATDTRWFHEFGPLCQEIRFLRGRLNFDDYKNAATFGSMIMVFRRGKQKVRFCNMRDKVMMQMPLIGIEDSR